ncbi:polysaccharide pyruvyl transferase family protein [Streptomyces sp. NPDC050560]|uniref:polysaccharide pyruvyl transferase family protein n=1 Tax=Streptomyces sp. NPDC050560 TaxID=3365630 RepID=UPI00379442A8
MAGTSHQLYYVVSPAGNANYGDELIAATWLRHIHRVAPDADVVVDCLDPVRTAARLGALHPGVRCVNTLWQLCLRGGTSDVAEVVRRVRSAVDDPQLAGDLAEGIGEARRADVVHIVGGGYVNSLWPQFTGLPAAAAAAVAHSGGRAVMTGQGLCPAADGGGETLRRIAADFDVVDVRDAPSAALLGPVPATHTGDDALLGVADHLRTAPDDAPRLVLSIQSQLSEVESEPLLGFLAGVVKAWGVDGIGLLECLPDEDREILELAERMLPVARRYGVDEVLAEGLPVAADQIWISSRFHPHLVAAAGGAGGIALNIRPDYYGTKHQSLIDAGSGWSLLNEPMIPARPKSGGFSPERRAELHGAKLRLAESVYSPGG